MNKHLWRDKAKKSLRDFIELEDGKLGKKDAMLVGSAIGATVLGQLLLGTVDETDAYPGYSQSSGGGHHQASF